MNYYNEHDPKAAAWLRELIRRELIPNGIVDERSITEVTSRDLRGYTQCHFFAGIGGWSLALQLAGWLASRPVGTGSCPCQPFSTAGKGLAQEDERHLWPVFFALICACRDDGQPWANTVFGEQVASAIGHGWLDGISTDLEAEGYACGATVLGAHSVQSPHQRQRLYWVADAGHMRGRNGAVSSQQAHDAAPGRREKRGMVIPECEGSQRLGITRGIDSSDGLREWFSESPAPSCQVSDGLVLSDSDGCSAGSSPATPAGHGDTTEPAGRRTGWVGNSNIQQTYPAEPGQQVPSERLLRCWDASQLVPCRDGKTRRIPTEPAFFPLAHGIPARVVRLRGYGNAIVPQVAAEFVKAYLET
mgnify:FL=1